jgi:hypothetical protein
LAYLRFLGEWYNLTWIGAVCAGLLLAVARRSAVTEGPRAPPGVLLVAAGVVGLTLNGAIHDVRLGPIERWFPLVALLALGSGWFIARGASRLRYRWFPPVRAVAFNQPGLAGEQAVVLSAELVPGRIGRARHRDETGVSHILRIHIDGGEPGALRFGSRVRLGAFDADRRSYPVEPV